MSLKEVISVWNEAVILFDEKKYVEAVEKFRSMPEQTAKIAFNIGSVYLQLKEWDQALTCYSESVSKDPYLAMAYFQRGCTNVKLKRYHNADLDFQSTLDKMRDHDLIDYRQLGLSVKLYTSQVLLNLAIVAHHLNDHEKTDKLLQRASNLVQDPAQEKLIASALSSSPNFKLNLVNIPLEDCIFRPPKSVVANLQKKDFLGKAKVISSVATNDNFVGFEGARKCHSNPASPTPSRRCDHLTVDDVIVKKGSLTPPPPSRPPPRRPSSALGNSKWYVVIDVSPPNRPPPLLNGNGGFRSTEKPRLSGAKSTDELRAVDSSKSAERSGLSGARSSDELRSSDRLRSNERSRPPPPSYPSRGFVKAEAKSANKVKPPRPPPPVIQRRL